MEELKELGRTKSVFMRELAGKFGKISKKCPHREMYQGEIWPRIPQWTCRHEHMLPKLPDELRHYCRHYNCPYLP